MEMKQVYEFVNEATKESLGDEGLVKEDLSNIVDVGERVLNANAVEPWTKALFNRIGKEVYHTRVYESTIPSVKRDAVEYGSIVMRVQQTDLIEATENESWELVEGASYDPHIFYAPKNIEVKFYNKGTTLEIDMSFTDKQIKQSFTSPSEMMKFVSMIRVNIENSLTLKMETLQMRTINNAIASTIFSDFPSGGYANASGVKAINLLKLYNDETGGTLTAAEALHNKEFLKFATYKVGVYSDRITRYSNLFNVGKAATFTPKGVLNIVLLSDFAKACDSYLESDTYHNELVALPNKFDTVPYWQGSGTSYAFADISKIKVTDAEGHDVEAGGILGVMFDKEALGVTSYDKRILTERVVKAEFTNYFFKVDARYYNNLNMNVVVFFVA